MKVYFFTCSYFRILYAVIHLKDSSTSIRVNIQWSTLNLHTWSAPLLWTTTQFLDSPAKFSFQITWRIFPPQWRNYFLTRRRKERKWDPVNWSWDHYRVKFVIYKQWYNAGVKTLNILDKERIKVLDIYRIQEEEKKLTQTSCPILACVMPSQRIGGKLFAVITNWFGSYRTWVSLAI